MLINLFNISLIICQDKIGTTNAIVVESIKSGEPKGYDAAGAAKPKSEAEIRCEKLSTEVLQYQTENADLKRKVEELELRLSQLEGNKARSAISDAKLIDSIVNGEGK
jgi:hypothetical protein